MDVIALLSAALLSGAGPGHVVEAESRAAVPGAWAVTVRTECSGFAHCNTGCFEVRVTRTDAKGQYPQPRSWLRWAYKDGYWEDMLPNGDLALSRTKVDRRFDHVDGVTARLLYLGQTAREMSCFNAPKEERAALLPVFKDMFAEARRIATLPEHRKLAQRICHEMYWLTVSGSDRSPPPSQEQAIESAYLRTIEPECAAAPPDDSDRIAVLRAIERNDVAALEKLLAAGFDTDRGLNDLGEPAVVVATSLRKTACVTALARSGARMDAVGASHRSAMDVFMTGKGGVELGRPLEVLEALLQGGANPNRPNMFGTPPLIRATEAGDAEVFTLLRRYGADINVRRSCQRADPNCMGKGDSVLHVVHDAKLAGIAIEQGAEVDALNAAGSTPLTHVASAEIARLLLDHGANPNAAGTGNWTPLMFAVQGYESYGPKDRYRAIAEMLVQAGARLDTKNQHGLDVFYYTKDEAFKRRLRELAAARPK